MFFLKGIKLFSGGVLLTSLLLSFHAATQNPARTQERTTPLTILHTNDWQSRFLGFGPNSNFSPFKLQDDQTVGGISRLASLIEEKRNDVKIKNILLLDAGDYSMGTLFHTINREVGAELQLLAALKYDAITLGNHDFDFRPAGLAQSIRSAINAGAKLPPIVISNMQFSRSDVEDDELQKLWQEKIIKPYVVIKKGEHRIGIFGLLGNDAIYVATNKAPLTFSDPIETAKKITRILKQEENVDFIILLSHGGIRREGGIDSNWQGEDVDLLEQVPEIDLIVGGHSHTPLTQPIIQGSRAVLQAGSEGQYLGELGLVLSYEKTTLGAYKLHRIDDSIIGHRRVQMMIEKFKEQVTQFFLSDTGFKFDQVIAETPVDQLRDYDKNVLANLVTDSILSATHADIVVSSNGAIRDSIYKGVDGKQWVSDLFRVVPLGIGVNNNALGYDLVKVWITGNEIKNLMEVLLVAHQTKGSSFYPRISGFQVIYNPIRVPFDQIFEIKLGNNIDGYKSIDISSNNQQLYAMATNSFVGSFTWLIRDFTHGLLNIQPKNKKGEMINEVSEAVFDADAKTEGVQEIKEWRAFLQFVTTLPDSDQNGLPELPSQAPPRIIEQTSYNPLIIFHNAGWIMIVAASLLVSSLVLFLFFVRYFLRRR